MGIFLKGQTPHTKWSKFYLLVHIRYFLKKSGEQDFFYNLEIRDRLVMSAFPHVKLYICLHFRAFPALFLFLFSTVHITVFVIVIFVRIRCDLRVNKQSGNGRSPGVHSLMMEKLA